VPQSIRNKFGTLDIRYPELVDIESTYSADVKICSPFAERLLEHAIVNGDRAAIDGPVYVRLVHANDISIEKSPVTHHLNPALVMNLM
jgi:hypothetical protein